MNILWLGKRFYTRKDALREKFGRMYRVPLRWQQAQQVTLWLIDYHSGAACAETDDGMTVVSTPPFSIDSLRQAWRTLAGKRPRIIVASGDCYIGLLGWLLARMTRAIFVFDVYDKYDEFKGYRKPFNIDIFLFLVKHADRLLFASSGLAKKISADFDAPFHVLANGVDSTLFAPLDLRACRLELGLPEDVRFVGYFGSMEPDRGIADLIEAVRRLRDNGVQVEILLAGGGASNLPLDGESIRYFGMVEQTKIPALIGACDVVVLPYRSSPFLDMAASCKIAEYLACRRPLVATATPNFLTNFPAQAAMMGQALCQVGNPVDMARALAYQLDSGLIPPPAENMSWQTIADSTLQWLQHTT